MKKILFCFLLATVSCMAQTDVVKFSGKIANRNSDMITIKGGSFKQTIPVAKDGTFAASFAVPEGVYEFYDGAEYTEMFLKNGFDLSMSMDAQKFDESIVYKGKGANENNILAKKVLDEEVLSEKLMTMKDKPDEVGKLIMEYSTDINSKMSAPGIDPGLKKAYDAKTEAAAEQQSKQKAQMVEQAKANAKLNGSLSPGFNFENHKGGKTKLEDFKGKYVYIDTWATWCGPCRGEIPFLQKVEEKYHGKNIEFVSISVDVKKDYEKWRKFVTDKNLGGTQLFADNDWNSEFIRAYGINSIPRFILIDPKGNIVASDAARPSDPELEKQLDQLLK